METFRLRIFIFISILLPECSLAIYYCSYNSTSRGLRNTVLLEYEHNKYIHLHDSKISILYSPNERSPYSDVYFVDNIYFEGYITQGENSSHVNVLINNLKYYRYESKRADNGCTVTFYESANDTMMLDSQNNRVFLSKEQKAIILRLAESCIRFDLCRIGAFKVDRDGDLSFESVQSTINYFADTGITSLINTFLNKDKALELSVKNTEILKSWHTNIELNDIVITGIDTIQRTDDVFISNEKNVYTVEFGYRFPVLSIALPNIQIWSLIVLLQDIFLPIVSLTRQITTEGESYANITINGFSFNTKVTINLESVNCSVKFTDFHIVSYKDINLYLAAGRAIPLSFKADPKTFEKFQQNTIRALNELVSKQMIDCQEYLNKLPGLLKNLL